MADYKRTNKWMIAIFFTAIGLFITYFVVFLLKGSPGSDYVRWLNPRGRSNAAPVVRDNIEIPGTILLPINQKMNYGNIIMKYLGLDNGDIILDIIIPEIDSEYAYLHRIPVKTAKQGFWLSDQQFKIISIDNSNLKLEQIRRKIGG